MNTTDASKSTIIRVGLFTFLAVALIGVMTVYVNRKPLWWKGCNMVFINIEDATGLRPKSAVRSLGLQVGYLKSIDLKETHVRLGICLTANVEVLPETRAYIRGEGFLGDKFVDIRPVRYQGGERTINSISSSPKTQIAIPADTHRNETDTPVSPQDLKDREQREEMDQEGHPLQSVLMNFLMPSAYAEDGVPKTKVKAKDSDEEQEVAVGKQNGNMDKIMESADKLLGEMTDLTKNLKEGLNPQELRATIQQLNKTLQAAQKTLSPEGGLNGTARRALEKLDDAFEQLRQQMTRINHGEGSLGKLINDPVYAEEVLKAAKSINKLLDKTSDIRFEVKLGLEQIPDYQGGRGFFQLSIWPKPDRYYRIGIAVDPRGLRQVTTTNTTSGGQTTSVSQETLQQTGIILTGMIGKTFFNRYDVSAGALYGDGTLSVGYFFGPEKFEQAFQIRSDTYARGQGMSINERLYAIAKPFYNVDGLGAVYVEGGMEAMRPVNGVRPWMFGAGVAFDDEMIKLLFALK